MPPPARLLVPLLRLSRRPAATRTHLNTLSKPLRCPTPSRRAQFSSELPQQFTQFSDAVRQRRYRNLRRVLTVAIFGLSGYYFAASRGPTNLDVYEPGSPEDIEELEYLQEEFDDSTLVKNIRAEVKFAESEMYNGLTSEEKETRFTSGALKGSRGISLQHIFFYETECVVAMMHLGPGLEGWPGIVHGGALSTIADETMGRVAVRALRTKTIVTANLDIKFTKPVWSGQFVNVLTAFDSENSTDRKAIVQGQIIDENHQVCAELNATFVVPKNLPLQEEAPKC